MLHVSNVAKTIIICMYTIIPIGYSELDERNSNAAKPHTARMHTAQHNILT